MPLFLVRFHNISCKDRFKDSTYHEVGTCWKETSCQLSNPRKEWTVFSWGCYWARAIDWMDVNKWTLKYSDMAKTRATPYGSYTIYKCESIWSIGFIDWLTILMNYSCEHEYRHSTRLWQTSQKLPSWGPKYKPWWTSWEWFDTSHISRLETIEKRERLVMRMSCPSFPTTYLRVGATFCDNYTA